MEQLVDAGLVKQIGVSNFSISQVEALLAQCRIKPVCNQVELHPLNSQRKLVGTLLRKVGRGSGLDLRLSAPTSPPRSPAGRAVHGIPAHGIV